MCPDVQNPIVDCPRALCHLSVLGLVQTNSKLYTAESDRARSQRHHDEVVMQINDCKSELRDKRLERGGVSDAKRKSGYVYTLHTL